MVAPRSETRGILVLLIVESIEDVVEAVDEEADDVLAAGVDEDDGCKRLTTVTSLAS